MQRLGNRVALAAADLIRHDAIFEQAVELFILLDPFPGSQIPGRTVRIDKQQLIAIVVNSVSLVNLTSFIPFKWQEFSPS